MKSLIFFGLGLVSIVLLSSFSTQVDGTVRTYELRSGRRVLRKISTGGPVEWPNSEACGKAPLWSSRWAIRPDAFCDSSGGEPGLSIRGGVRESATRLSNGVKAQLGEYPSYVRLEITRDDDDELILCGGTLVAKDVVMTSARCLKNLKSAFAYAGITESTNLGSGQKRRVKFVCPAEIEETDIPRNDIGMIRVERPFIYNNYVQPACLLPERSNMKNGTCYFIGMGYDGSADSQGLTLNWLRMKRNCDYRNTDLAATAMEADESEDRACYQSAERERVGHPCTGDTGGPMICNRRCGYPSQQVIVGSASYSRKKCSAEGPTVGIFADFHKLRDLVYEFKTKCFR